MGYTPQYQFLAPGAALMPEANPIPFGALLENKKWRTGQTEKLAKQQALLDKQYQDIRATNDFNARKLEQRANYYNTEQERVLNDKKLTTTEKYNKMIGLGSQAANDVALQDIRSFSKGYEANKKAIEEEKASLDPEVYAAAMADIEAKNQIGIGEVDDYRSFNKWENVMAKKTPEMAKNVQEYLKGIKANKTPIYTEDGRIMQADNFGVLRWEDNSEVTAEEATRIAKNYVNSSPAFTSFFEQKDRGAEIIKKKELMSQGHSEDGANYLIKELREQNGGTVFDKEAYIDKGIAAAVDYAAYTEIGAHTQNDAQLAATIAYKRKKADEVEEVVVPPAIETSVDQVTGVNNTNSKRYTSPEEVAQLEGSYAAQTQEHSAEIKAYEEAVRNNVTPPITASQYKQYQIEQQAAINKLNTLVQTRNNWEDNTIQNNNEGVEAVKIKRQLEGTGQWDRKTNTIDFYKNVEFQKDAKGNIIKDNDLELGEVTSDISNVKDYVRTEYVRQAINEASGVNMDNKEFVQFAKRLSYVIDQGYSAEAKPEFFERAGIDRATFVKALATKDPEAVKKVTDALKWPENQEQALIKLGGYFYKHKGGGSSHGQEFDDVFDAMAEDMKQEYYDAYNNHIEKVGVETPAYSTGFLAIPEIEKGLASEPQKKMANESYANALSSATDIINQKNAVVYNTTTGEAISATENPELLTGFVAEEFSHVGMDELDLGGGEEYIPIIVKGTLTTYDDTGKATKVPTSYTMYSSRDASGSLYTHLGNYLNQANVTDKSGAVDFVKDRLNNTVTTDAIFENADANLKISDTKNNYSTEINIPQLTKIPVNNRFILQGVDNTIQMKKTGSQNYQYIGENLSPSTTFYNGLEQTLPDLHTFISNIDPKTTKLPPIDANSPEGQLFLTMTDGMLTGKALEAKRFTVDVDSRDDSKILLQSIDKEYKNAYKAVNVPNQTYRNLMDMLGIQYDPSIFEQEEVEKKSPITQ